MKIATKHIFYFFALTASYSYSQTNVIYSYDLHGNRTQRKLDLAHRSSRMSSKDSSQIKKDENDGAIIAMNHGINAYPNPSRDKIVVSLSNITSSNNENCKLYLLDNSGKVLLQKRFDGTETEINLIPFNTGTYHIQVSFGKENLYYKIIKSE
jgi:hypothetical protein